MIKFALRRNLIYPLQLIIWHFLRNVETILIGHFFNFKNSQIYTSIMFIGEFVSGLIIYLYEKNFVKRNKKPAKFLSITLIQNEAKLDYPDSNTKIFILIFFIAFFDWFQFYIWTVNIPRTKNISTTFLDRLNGAKPIICSFVYYYVLRLPVFKHQIFSLIIIGICFAIIIISEFCFQKINIVFTYLDFILVLLMILLNHILSSLIDLVEKYLFEYNFLNPFYVLMWEGIFGFFISFLFFLMPDYLDDIKQVYNTLSTGKIILFTFLLLLYIILSGGRNIFRVVTIKLYSPMARGLTDYFLQPFYSIYYFSMGTDFLVDEKRNILYFTINLILSIILSICGCIYNEFIILFFCGFERNTHDQISKRANIISESLYSINDELESFDFNIRNN